MILRYFHVDRIDKGLLLNRRNVFLIIFLPDKCYLSDLSFIIPINWCKNHGGKGAENAV